MSERRFYVVCDDDCRFESMTKEQILTAIQESLEQGFVSDPDGAVISKIKEIGSDDSLQIWKGTEAEFNALGIKSERVTLRVNGDGVIYICEDDTTIPTMEGMIQEIFNYVYPVGSIIMTATSENPSSRFGGTWKRIAEGRTLVGVKESDADFSSFGKTGGEKAHKLTTSEMPSHTHSQASHAHHVMYTGSNSVGDGKIYADWIDASGDDGIIGANILRAGSAGEAGTLQTRGTASSTDARANPLVTDYKNPTINATGGNQAHNNMPPFFTCYIWQKISGDPYFNSGLPDGDAVAY